MLGCEFILKIISIYLSEHEIKTQTCAELQTLRDWGGKNVQIQSGREAPPKKNESKSIMEKKTLFYTPANQQLCMHHNGKEVSCCKINGTVKQTESKHENTDLEKWSVFKWQFLKYEIKCFRCYISEM